MFERFTKYSLRKLKGVKRKQNGRGGGISDVLNYTGWQGDFRWFKLYRVAWGISDVINYTRWRGGFQMV